jgi:hypothetical protein
LENSCNILVRKLEKKRPYGRLGHIRQENIKNVFKEIGCEGVNWIQLTEDTVK